MSDSHPTNLEDLIRDSGESRLIDDHVPKAEAMPRVRRLLSDAQACAVARGLGASVPLEESAIIKEYVRNPANVKAFLQALRITSTPEMLLMVWRIIQGMEIQTIKASYERQASFQLQVVLRSPYEEKDERYESSIGGDLRLLKHVGVFEIDRKPVFDGFYAQR